MSTDYSLLIQSDSATPVGVWQPVLNIKGVSHSGTICIKGLTDVECKLLDKQRQDIFLEEYGNYGISLNWEIRGTYDKSTDIFEVIELLYRCAAEYVNSLPSKNVCLMRDCESFYVHYSGGQLRLSTAYIKSISSLTTLFNRQFVVDEMKY